MIFSWSPSSKLSVQMGIAIYHQGLSLQGQQSFLNGSLSQIQSSRLLRMAGLMIMWGWSGSNKILYLV
ncbi:hypothetical protein EDD85DRAFT_889377, partial [Armillaria nabsnona]